MLGIHAVPQAETLGATVTYLLAMLSPLNLGIKQLYLDRGFYGMPVIRWLQALNLPFVMPVVIRGKKAGTRALLKGRKSYATDYSLKSAKQGLSRHYSHLFALSNLNLRSTEIWRKCKI